MTTRPPETHKKDRDNHASASDAAATSDVDAAAAALRKLVAVDGPLQPVQVVPNLVVARVRVQGLDVLDDPTEHLHGVPQAGPGGG